MGRDFAPSSLRTLWCQSLSDVLPIYQAKMYPNPFNPELTISLDIYEMSRGEISIYNIKGQLVKNLYCGTLEQGEQKLTWKGNDNSGRPVSSGVYFCKIRIGGTEEIMKAVLMK